MTQIGSSEIADNSVRSVDLRNNSVRGIDIRNGSVRARDLAGGVIPRDARVRRGTAATPGANGSGAGCVDGVPGGSKGYQDQNGLVSCGGGAGGSAASTAECKAGEVATGGGYTFASGKRHALVAASRPVLARAGGRPTGWRIKVETLTNDPSNTTPVTPYVVCMRP